MPVNKDELAKDIAENPEYLTLVTAELTKKEFVVQDKATHTTFMDNFKKDVVEKEIPARIKEVHDRYDKDSNESFADIKRLENEKTYDFIKRAAKLRTDEIATLREEMKNGDKSGIFKKRIEDLEEKTKNDLKLKDDEIGRLKGETSTASKRIAVNNAYTEVRAGFLKTLPPMFERTAKTILAEYEANTIIEEGIAYVGNADGTIKKDASYNKIKIVDALKDEFKEVIDTKKGTGGAGSGGGNGGGPEVDPSKITIENFERPEKIKSLMDLDTHMMELGLQKGSDLYNKIYKKFGMDAKLPLQIR